MTKMTNFSAKFPGRNISSSLPTRTFQNINGQTLDIFTLSLPVMCLKTEKKMRRQNRH